MKLYVLYHCNEWQEHASLRFIGVVDADTLESALHQIQNKMEYTDEDMEKYIYCDQISLNKLNI